MPASVPRIDRDEGRLILEDWAGDALVVEEADPRGGPVDMPLGRHLAMGSVHLAPDQAEALHDFIGEWLEAVSR